MVGMRSSARRSGILLLLLLPCATPAFAGGPKAPPDSLADSPNSWTDTEDWKFLLGTAYCDTLDAPRDAVIRAAEAAFRGDDWVLQADRMGWAAEERGERLVTDWKPIHNLIFRLFAGRSVARCFASVATTEDGRTELTFQGGLAARHDLQHNQMRGPAERSYRKAVTRWQGLVREAVAHDGSMAAAIPAETPPTK
jgi:hypothetical protein